MHCSATVTASTACIMIEFHGKAKIGAVLAVTVAEQCHIVALASATSISDSTFVFSVFFTAAGAYQRPDLIRYIFII